ncbi:hypothetical protein Tco_1326960 [Tanacetum coccineum]
MANLKFADTHNMVAFLSKPKEGDGFKQIVDFLNAHPIKYALTVNPTIYIACIEQFWSTVKDKTINGEVQLHALVDGKKIIITESTVRRDLQLEDAEGVDCLPNSTIFEQLTLMGSKTTAWNEFSSTMSSAIICLATNQKFNFSKYIFESMIRNLDNLSGKILMYPRRVGKGFSGRVTPLFQTMLVQNQSELGEGSSNPTDPHHTLTIIQSSTQPQKTQKPRKPKRKDTQVSQPSGPTESVAHEVVHKELGNSLVRVATTASSLEAEQDNGNITKTRSKETPNEYSSLGTTSGGGPRGNTLRSDEDRLKLNELMALCTTLQSRVLDFEKTKTTQANEIASLKMRVKKLEKKRSSRTQKLKRLYKVGLTARVESSGDEEDLGEDASKQGKRINAIDADKDITLVFVAGQNENVVEEVVNAAQVSTVATTVTITTKEITLAQALEALKLQNLRLAREKAEKEKEANVALTEEWDDIQAKIDVDYQLVERFQAEEQEELSDAEKATLFQQLLEKRRKHFAAKSAEEKRNKPPTQVQQRKIMCTYLKNMEGKKPKDLKNKSFDSIQKMFDRAFKRMNTFVDFRTDLVEDSSKRAGAELEQESTKNQKVDEDKDTAELQSLMEFIPDEEEVAIDVVPLATKSLKIVDWKIHKEGKKSYYQIVRADGKPQMYMIFSQILKSFDREDLEDLYKLVKARYGSTRPVESMD